MPTPKRASMREGPLAQLFRKTAEDTAPNAEPLRLRSRRLRLLLPLSRSRLSGGHARTRLWPRRSRLSL